MRHIAFSKRRGVVGVTLETGGNMGVTGGPWGAIGVIGGIGGNMWVTSGLFLSRFAEFLYLYIMLQ